MPSARLAFGVEHGGELCLDETAEQLGDGSNMLVAHLLALGAEALAHLAPERTGIDELHLALAMRRLAVRDDPDIGGNAGVVEHIGRQADDGLDQIVLQHVAADFALARARTAGEQRRAIEHDAEAAAAVLRRAHLGEEMHEEQQRAIRHARQAGTEAAIEALALVLLADFLLDLLPLNAERRIGQHVVELRVSVAVFRQRVARDDVGDILPLDQHVRLADRIALVVQLLPEHREPGLRVQRRKMFARDRQHSARACGRVVDGADHAGLGQHVIVLDEQQIDHEADDFARREVLTGRFVRQFGELADQLLEGEPHLVVADGLGMQVDAGELLGDLIEQTALGQLVDLGGEIEPLEDVADGGRERLHIGKEVLADVVLIAHQLAHVHGRGVVEALAGGAEQERVRVQLLLSSWPRTRQAPSALVGSRTQSRRRSTVKGRMTLP